MFKCTFDTFGPSGKVQEVNGLCFSPLDGFNEMIFNICIIEVSCGIGSSFWESSTHLLCFTDTLSVWSTQGIPNKYNGKQINGGHE